MNQANSEEFQRPPHYREDEFSLVGLARTVIRRRMVFVITSLAVFAAGVAFALVIPKTYMYTSIYSLATVGAEGKPLLSPTAALTRVESVYLPEQIAAFEKTFGHASVHFQVQVTNPPSTTFIMLRSRSTVSEETALKAVHEATLKQLESYDKQLVAQQKAILTARIKAAETQLKMFRDSADTAAVISALQAKDSADRTLSTLAAGRIVTLAKRSLKARGPARGLIIGTAFLVAIMLGLFSVVFAEFVAAVKAADS